MKRQFVRVAVGTVLVLTALVGALPHLAADSAPPAGTLLIVAGTGEKGYSGDSGPATQAQLTAPIGLGFDGAGDIFIADRNDTNSRLRKVTPQGIISTVAGGGKTRPRTGDDIPAAEALLGDANSVAFDGAGNYYLSGFYGASVWKVSPDGMITVIRRMEGPTDLAVDTAGNLFIGDFFGGKVLKRSPDGRITTVAGGGTRPPNTADGGPATAAKLEAPWGMALDAVGNLFFVEWDGARVRKVSPDGIISTVAGTGQHGFSGDGGPAIQAQLEAPTGLAVDSVGNLFIADFGNYRVRKVSPEGIITTVAGTGEVKLTGVGGPATRAGLRGPVGLAVDAAGNLFIADTAWIDHHLTRNSVPASEHVLMVVGVAAPGLIAGKPFPQP